MKIEHMLRPLDVTPIKNVVLVAVVGELLIIYAIVRMSMTDFEQVGWWVVTGVTIHFTLLGIVIASLAFKKCRRIAELNTDLSDNLGLVMRCVNAHNFDTFYRIVTTLYEVKCPWYRLKTCPLTFQGVKDLLVLTYHCDKAGHKIEYNTTGFSQSTLAKVYERHGTNDVDTLRLAAFYVWAGEAATRLGWEKDYYFECGLYANNILEEGV